MATKQTVSFVFLGIALIFGANAMDSNRGEKKKSTVSPDRNSTAQGSTEKGRKKSVPGGYGPGADARKAQKALALANEEFVRRGFLAPAKPPNGNNTLPQSNETAAGALQELRAQSKAAVARVDTTATALTDVAKEGDNAAGSKATVAGEEATTKDSANDAAETEAASVADEAGPASTESGTKEAAEGKATAPVADKAGAALTEVGTEEATGSEATAATMDKAGTAEEAATSQAGLIIVGQVTAQFGVEPVKPNRFLVKWLETGKKWNSRSFCRDHVMAPYMGLNPTLAECKERCVEGIPQTRGTRPCIGINFGNAGEDEVTCQLCEDVDDNKIVLQPQVREHVHFFANPRFQFDHFV